MNRNKRIAVIGAGAMGAALVTGLLKGGVDPSCITLSNPHEAKLQPFAGRGVKVTANNVAAVMGADCIVLAVKPWVLPEVVAQLRGHIDYSRQSICAIVAGVTGNDLIGMFGANECNPRSLSICMPNTAMALGQSMTFVVPLTDDGSCAKELLDLVGTTKVIAERQLPGAMALASCGIAYALRYVRAATQGGVQLGFPAREAQEIVTATIQGAAALLSHPGAHAEAEIDKVTTPGGFTIRGLNAMENRGFTPAVIAGLLASV